MSAPILQTLHLDLLRLVRLVRSSPIRLLKNGLPGKRVLQSIVDELVVHKAIQPLPAFEDSGYPLFLYEQAYQLELLEEKSGQLFCDQERAEAFFQLPAREQIEQLVENWRMLVHWNEMRRVTSLVVRDLETPSEPLWTARRLVRARKQLLRTLPSLLEIPRPLSELTELVLEKHPDLLSLGNENNNRYERLWWKTGEDERSLEYPQDQSLVEGEFLRICLTESLTWLGLVHVTSDQDSIVTWRGYPNLPPSAPAAEAPPFLVQPNLTILVFPSPQLLPQLFRLEQFAQPLSGDQILRYKLEEKNFLEALQMGLTVEEVLAFLAEKSRVPLPQNVQQLLLTWHQQSSQIIVSEDGTILEADSEEELQEILSSFPSTIQVRILDETRLFIPASCNKALATWSKTVPVVELDYQRPPPRCLNIEADLSVQLDLIRADLYIRPFLERIATLHPSPQSYQELWIIEREKLEIALQEELAPEDLFAFLDVRAHIFSSTARFRLEAFCGLLGNIYAGSQQVVLTPDSAIMDRLLYEGGLRNYAIRLGPAAAMIEEEKVELAYKLLTTYALPTTDTPLLSATEDEAQGDS